MVIVNEGRENGTDAAYGCLSTAVLFFYLYRRNFCLFDIIWSMKLGIGFYSDCGSWIARLSEIGGSLDNWGGFEKRVDFVPEISWDIPASSILIYDNSGVMNDEQVKLLHDFTTYNESIIPLTL